MLLDYQIAQKTPLHPIGAIARQLGLKPSEIEVYGKYKAKIPGYADWTQRANQGEKLVLVTAINPTPAGEGKTTTSIGLADALGLIGKSAIVALREPSLGPVFGIKGGATGGGFSQVAPMEEINLHFTGDFHAITSAHNLLAALLDNHIKQGNQLAIDSETIALKRVLDVNDRQLRNIVDGLESADLGQRIADRLRGCGAGGNANRNVGGGRREGGDSAGELEGEGAGTGVDGGQLKLGASTQNGLPRADGFEITVASEVMAILCLAKSLSDLRTRLGKIIVAYNRGGEPVTAGDLRAAGAMTALLKDAIKPNLVQTLAGTPALIHGGPFANIAHGCNSVIATKTACGLIGRVAGTDGYVITEAGFGADLGAEKFIDLKCQTSGLFPDSVVLVATIRALKSHGGVERADLDRENLSALTRGLPNLLQHIDNLRSVYRVPLVVALNRFTSDTPAEIALVQRAVAEYTDHFSSPITSAHRTTSADITTPADTATPADVTTSADRVTTANRTTSVDTATSADAPTSADTATSAHPSTLPPVDLILCDFWASGGAGGRELAQKVVELAEISTPEDQFAYQLSDSIIDKIDKIATRIYRADGVDFTPVAQAQIRRLEQLQLTNLPVCIAKTQYSFSDQPSLLAAPRGFNLSINRVEPRAGAGFIVAFAGNILTMPGLPKVPAAEQIDVNDSGRITGIF